MLQTTLTHYWPDDELDAPCGAPLFADGALTAAPTCPICAAAQAADDAANGRWAEEALLPLTDDDARYAGVPVVASPAGDVVAYAAHLTRTYAALAVRTQARRLHGGRR